jgi:phosphate:Na+ symporter
VVYGLVILDLLILAGSIIGGLGLFILAIEMMTDGIKLAAGSKLRHFLAKSSKTPLRGIFSGFLMTAIVQSSSAVTVASIGFVNAGLINMRQALGIIYGSNVGTTMTGWLVAIIGFKLNIQAFALPMIGFGMLLKLVNQTGRLASFGMALVGFGLFFVGIDVLKSAFDGIVLAFDITQFSADGVSGVIVFLLIGIVMTILTQSSSASIALTITAASSGLVGVYAAGAMVIGANVGTTSTALIAAIGATSHAKRVAAAQVIFNVSTAMVAIITLPMLFYLVEHSNLGFELSVNAAVFLAVFHTIFNVLGVLLIYPLNNRLALFLEKRFLTWEERESHPRFLDKAIAQTPVLAVNALILEALAISDRVLKLFSCAVSTSVHDLKVFDNQAKVIKLLSADVAKFIVNIESAALSAETTSNLATLMRIEQYFLSCTLGSERLSTMILKREKLAIVKMEEQVNQFYRHVSEFMQRSRLNDSNTQDWFDIHLKELQSEHDGLKANLIMEGTRANISVIEMSETIDCLAEVLIIANLWCKAMKRLYSIQNEVDLLGGDSFDSTHCSAAANLDHTKKR